MSTKQLGTIFPTAVARLGLVLILLTTMLSDVLAPRAAASPAAQTAPTAVTNAATGVSASAATLNGTVNAGGENTTAWFEYGLDTSYGDTLFADSNPVTGSTDTAVSVAISDLLPNTTYHYRVVAQNASGTTYGDDMNLTTADFAIPAAVTNAASNVTTSGATLNGTVNAHGDMATVFFEYGLDASYGTTVTAAPSPASGTSDTAVSQAVTGLLPNTTYHYRVAARNASHITYGTDQAFTTQSSVSSADTGAATNVEGYSAVLNGSVNAGGVGQMVFFEYGLTPSYERIVEAGQSPVAGTADITVSAAISGLIPNTTYYYRVVAQSAQSTLYGTNRSFTTTNLANPPTAVTVVATSVTAGGATLNGTVNAWGSSTTVTFQYGLTTAYGTTVTAAQSPVGGTSDTAVSRSIGGLADHTTYHYRVVAQNINGVAYGADMIFVAGEPITPSAVTNAATGVSGTAATLNGTVNAGNAKTTVSFQCGLDTNYGHTTLAEPSPVSGTSDTAVSGTLVALIPNTTYHYRVMIQSVYGTFYGADITFTTHAITPTAITGNASAVTTTAAVLNGVVNANNANTTVTFEYGLDTAYGATVAAEPGLVSGLIDVAVSKAISGLLPNTTYHYRVVAQNASGVTYGADRTFYTGDPAAVTATTLVALDVTATGATLQGLVNANGNSTTVFFEYGLDITYGHQVEMQQDWVTGTTNITVSAMLANLLNHTTFHYRVVAQNAYGTYYGADMTFTTGTFPAVATNAASNVLAATATLNGTVNANENSTTVFFEYGLDTRYGTTVAAEPGTVSGTADTVVSRTIVSLLPNTTYHYRVVAQNVNGTARGADMTFTTSAFPIAVTNAASNVHTTTAILNGTVNARRNNTTVFFEYGLDTSYGATIAAEPGTVSGIANTAVSRTIASLLPDTTYHYRVVAQNVNGTTYGDDLTFSTSYIRVYLPLVLKGYVSGPDLVVQRIDVTGHDAQVIIANIGNTPVVDDFWVDLYVNPRTAPTRVNQIWPDLADQGLVWGVTADLRPGDVLTLTVGDAYYIADYSQITWPLAAGTLVYAQVDSADADTTYGAVLEIHEITGGAYNNIASTTSTARAAQGALDPAQAAPAVEASHLPRRR